MQAVVAQISYGVAYRHFCHVSPETDMLRGPLWGPLFINRGNNVIKPYTNAVEN